MCLGVPGRIVELTDEAQLARVDVNGVGRTISTALLEDEALSAGDWVLIHVGFAIAKIDEDEAREAMATLQLFDERDADEADGPTGPAGSTVR
jgi:hydrogenase expression/formation protein HypC